MSPCLILTPFNISPEADSLLRVFSPQAHRIKPNGKTPRKGKKKERMADFRDGKGGDVEETAGGTKNSWVLSDADSNASCTAAFSCLLPRDVPRRL